MANNKFQRYEIKFLLTKEQKYNLKELMIKYMQPTEYSVSTINNIYYDTDDHLLIRRSLEKPIYKEKLRVRSYGTATEDSKVFIELKKKFDGVVYKRRIATSEKEACKFLNKENSEIQESQISKELNYCLKYYPTIKPAMYLSYDREAFEGIHDKDFRMTFDENILARETDIDLKHGPKGQALIDENQTILEVKTALAIPQWLLEFLSENKIYKTSFSKYGTAYQKITLKNQRMTNYLTNKALILDRVKTNKLTNNTEKREHYYAIN